MKEKSLSSSGCSNYQSEDKKEKKIVLKLFSKSDMDEEAEFSSETE